jgi:hypothetical protein
VRVLVFQARRESDEQNRTAAGLIAIYRDVDSEAAWSRVCAELGPGIYQVVIERPTAEGWRFQDAEIAQIE